MISSLSAYGSSLKVDSRTPILTVLLIILLWKLLARRRTSLLLSKLPGPPAYPIIGNLLEFLGPRERVFHATIARGKKYGPIYRTWLGSHGAVHLSHPEYIEEVLHSSKHLGKGFAYKFLEPFLGAGLITANGSKWLTHRKILTPAFHFKILDSFFDVFEEQSNVLVCKLDRKADSGKEFDIYNDIKHCALDVICEAAMGVKVNAQTSSESKYVNSIYMITQLIAERIRRLWLHPDVLFNMTNLGKEHRKHLQIARNFVEKVIQERRKIRSENESVEKANGDENGRKKRLAFLDLLLETAENGKNRLTDEEIREEVDTFMFAGHDTTTASITWAIYVLGRHQKIQDDLYQEQREIFEGDMERPITQDDISKMKLLDRVIKECLRLYPSVPFISRYLDEDVKFGDYLVPKNTSCMLHIYALHRNPEIYPDPDKFDPDRFLQENVDKRHNYAYIPFSAGARNCLGKRFALLEEKFVLASLFRRYKITSTEMPEDLALLAELILRPLSGVKVKLERRGANVNAK